MKKTFSFFFLFVTIAAFAQEGHEIKVTLKPFKNQYIYLGHYFGKQLPIIDSVKLNDKSEGVFKGPKKLGGGIYLIGFPDRSRNFEVLIGKNQHFSIFADTATLHKKIDYINSPENLQFTAYQDFMVRNGRAIDSLRKAQSASPKDSIQLGLKIEPLTESIKTYRLGIINNEPDGLLATLLKGMKEPEVPKNIDRTKDSLAPYRYYKQHYWDGVAFWDDRLARTPFFEGRVDKYFEQLVYPAPDSVIKEIDWMMGFAANSPDMQKFLLLKFVNRYLAQKYMWEDAVFVHLFEKYFSQKTYPWLTTQGMKVITDRAYSLMANIFGSPASDVELPDSTGKTATLYGIKSPYTLLVIWDPTCGHCKEVLPRLDTMYRTKWKALGLTPFALAKETDGNKKDWTGFVQKYNLKDWVHVYYSKEAEKARVNSGIPSYSQLFDVQTFPTLYLLDSEKRIIAKKITEQQVDEILDQRLKNAKQ